MVTEALLAERRARLSEGDLPALVERLRAKALALLDREIIIPELKAQLSVRAGTCPDCRTTLLFDPWSPDRHRCPSCGKVETGELHHRYWARAQHLWVAERAAHLAAVGGLVDDDRMVSKARELVLAYHPLYLDLPNRDNVLGPSHLFFSTYLESLWVLNYLAAAQLLRAQGALDQADEDAVNAIADEAASVIGEFNEGLSNRQTWNSAALTAIGVWFGDDELIQSSVEERSGLLGHLADGFGADGMWFEGENYHLFALRGLLIGLSWATSAGVDLLADGKVAAHLGRALLAPAESALPNLTFPARKDSRFGVSLAHPAYLECWEAGLTSLRDDPPNGLAAWLRALYETRATSAATYDAYLHDAGEIAREATGRADLSWWMLFAMEPTLPPSGPWAPSTLLLADQGLPILRHGDRYISLECGEVGGGHGHPDRLHLTVFSGGRHWLPDPGTGSYVTPDLEWYRSTWAHNAPLRDGQSQPLERAQCVAFDRRGEWAWMVGQFQDLRRTVVAGPGWLVDQVELASGSSHRFDLPWHFQGTIDVETAGRWIGEASETPFVTQVERFEPGQPGPVVVRLSSPDGARLSAFMVSASLLRAVGPGLPTDPAPAPFLIQREQGASVWVTTVLDFDGTVSSVSAARNRVTVVEASGPTTIEIGPESATVSGRSSVTLGGVRRTPPSRKPFLSQQPLPIESRAVRVAESPALDGTLEGFDLADPIELADEAHYNRSEEPYQGQISATAYFSWDEEALYVGVQVIKPEVIVRGPDAPPLELDNDPDDIHADGVQVHVRFPGGTTRGALVRPTEDGGVAARPIPIDADPIAVRGASSIDDDGYTLTFALPCPELAGLGREARIELDLVVNEATADRVRRAGQLAWATGGGWVYLRSDRHDSSRFGRLELLP